jgi:DNA polymerase III alpha subunit (gram-positive type)
MKEVVFDTDGDGLAYECTKLHILSYSYDGKDYQSTADYEEMVEFFSQPETLFVAHNSIKHDMVAINRILGVPMDYNKYVDTLALSWFLYPDRQSHGLGSYQSESGLEKPKVDDWENVTYAQMKHRCEADVSLNWWLWMKQRKRLQEIYG